MFGRAQPAGGLAVVALRRRDVSRGAVGRRVGRLATVPSTPKFEILPNLPNVDIFARHSHFNFEENLATFAKIGPVACWPARVPAAAAPRYVV